MKRYATLTVLVVVALAAIGCNGGGEGPFDQNAQAPASSISPRPSWSISGQGVSNDAAAIDGDLSTRAVTASGYEEASLTVDLGKPCLFNLIVIDHGDHETGYAERLAVLTSMDGLEYTRQKVASGQRGRTWIALVTPVMARYVRIEVVRPHWQPWSVAEVQIK
ncbi:MAG: discoidin domain-containing protein [Planctomycetota bacterium]|jgi:hypothetical protein